MPTVLMVFSPIPSVSCRGNNTHSGPVCCCKTQLKTCHQKCANPKCLLLQIMACGEEDYCCSPGGTRWSRSFGSLCSLVLALLQNWFQLKNDSTALSLAQRHLTIQAICKLGCCRLGNTGKWESRRISFMCRRHMSSYDCHQISSQARAYLKC